MFELAIVIGISVFALILAAILARSVLAQDEGTPKMREVSDAIRVGAEAFIKRQYSTIAILAIVLAVVIFGVALFPVFGAAGILFPLVMCALGLLASMIGIICVRGKDGGDPMDAMN